MSTKKFLFGLMAVAMCASCSNDNEPQAPQVAGETETSYIAFTVGANGDSSRATTADDFAAGTEAENAATTAHFFFFDASGNAFTVNTESQTNGAVNYVTATTLTGNAAAMPNVERIYDAVVVIKKNKDAVPAKVVAVLNWNYTGSSLSLAELNEKIVSDNYATANSFLMSSSVFANGTTVAQAADITAGNLAATEDAAKASPVAIYVERVAAKVVVSTTSAASGAVKVAELDMVGETAKQPVYAKVVGWDLNGTINQTYLNKHINTAWTYSWWNEATKFRSYFAQVPTGETVSIKNSFSWNSLSNAAGAADYCMENTEAVTAVTAVAMTDVEHLTHVMQATKALVAVQLYTDEACTTPATIASWYGAYYTIEGLKNLIASNVNLWKDVNGGKSEIELDDFELVQDFGATDEYKVTYKLTETGAAATWYQKTQSGDYVSVENAQTVLDKVEKALAWNGMAYYIVPIRHLGNWSVTDNTYTFDAAAYGVVRNHAYGIEIEGIEGLGTPVYDPENDFQEPEIPVETESYIAAQINVLSWRIVSQSVTLK